MRCNFVQTGQQGDRYRYTCDTCGRVTAWIPTDDTARVHAVCGSQTAKPPCIHRETLGVVPGDYLDCRCRSVTLYRCGLFGETVTDMPLAPEHTRIISDNQLLDGVRTNYLGRTCRGCESRLNS